VVTEHRHRCVRARSGPPRPDAARRRQHLTALSQLLLRKGKQLAREPPVPTDLAFQVIMRGRAAIYYQNDEIVYDGRIVNAESENNKVLLAVNLPH